MKMLTHAPHNKDVQPVCLLPCHLSLHVTIHTHTHTHTYTPYIAAAAEKSTPVLVAALQGRNSSNKTSNTSGWRVGAAKMQRYRPQTAAMAMPSGDLWACHRRSCKRIMAAMLARAVHGAMKLKRQVGRLGQSGPCAHTWQPHRGSGHARNASQPACPCCCTPSHTIKRSRTIPSRPVITGRVQAYCCTSIRRATKGRSFEAAMKHEQPAQC